MQRDAVLRPLERRAARSGWPRATMLGLVTLTGLAGFLTSAALLHLHLTSLWLRYGLSVALAYGLFLALVSYWARLHHRPRRRRTIVGSAAPSTGVDWSPFDSLDFDLDGLLAVIVAVAAFSLIAAAWYTAALIVGAMGATLYSRLQDAHETNWFRSVFQRTKRPFFAFLLFYVRLGIVARMFAPEAISIGGVVRHLP